MNQGKERDRITIRLTPDLLREVERIAARELTPPTVLMRRWINERVEQDRKTVSSE